MSRRILVVLPTAGSWLAAFREVRGVDLVFVLAGQDDLRRLAADISAEGIIVCADPLGEFPEAPHLDIPTVFLGGNGGHSPHREVRADAGIGSVVATAFADAGRTRIALVGTRVSSKTERPEVLAFLKTSAIHDLQLPRALVLETMDSPARTAELFRARLDVAAQLPQAIFCTSAGCALGAHDVVSALGLDIPDEVTIFTLADEDSPVLAERSIVALVPDTVAMVHIALDRLSGADPDPVSLDGTTVPHLMIGGKRESQATRALARLLQPSDM